MDKRTHAQFEARAKVIKAMAHASRLFIIHQLSFGEQCVCELRDMVGADMSTVSKHLSVLKNAGIVETEKRGVQVFYTLKVPCVLNFMTCVEAVLQRSAADSAELVTAG